MTAIGPAGPQAPPFVDPASDPYAGLTPIVAKQVAALIQASHGKVRLVSGYRTLAEQNALYQQAAKQYGESNAAAWVADPNNSNHVKGSAVDLAGDVSVMRQLAPQFGLNAPMSWEPWHFEMSSTPQHSSPAAYTTPPPGETNPTQADTSTSAPHAAAAFAESLLPLTTAGLGSNGLPMNEGQAAVNAVETPQQAGSGAQPAAGPQGSSSTSAGGANIPGGHGNVSPSQLYGALTSAGLDPTAAAAFVSIAGRESGYNTGAHNGNRATGDDSYGLFQINLLNGGWGPFLEAHGIQNPAQALTTLQGSVQAAKAIYDSSGLHPWGGYKGMPWYYNTDLNTGAQASGGAVTVADLQGLGGG